MMSKKVFDKNKIQHKEVDILCWKESNTTPSHYENFEAFYMIKMYLISYDGDREIKVKFNNKYKIIKYLDIALNDRDCFVINGKLYGSEADLEVLSKEAQIIDPIIEQKKRDSWKGFFNEK